MEEALTVESSQLEGNFSVDILEKAITRPLLAKTLFLRDFQPF